MAQQFEVPVVKIETERWWRSERDCRNQSLGVCDDAAPEPVDKDACTKGVFSLYHKQHYKSTYAVGYSTVSTAVKSDGGKKYPIAGFSGFKPGVTAGNIIGKTHQAGMVDAQFHLMNTTQAEFPKTTNLE